jgi:Alpha-kinase family
MAHSSAARTNLSSANATVDYNNVLGEGAFRIVYSGIYVGGRRNQQEAACKSFKFQYKSLESEYYQFDFKIADRAIQYAEIWNGFCDGNRAIQISRGTVLDYGSHMLLIEPLITPYIKFTSNNGWISDDAAGLAMEAFTHFTYHQSGGSLIVCDLQGRWRKKSGPGRPRRYELSDPAICSRSRSYGPTDLGEKGIDSFFCNHTCNDFCYRLGNGHWARPRNPKTWFVRSSSTSMIGSAGANMLTVTNSARFTSTLQAYYEDDSDSDY